MPLPFASPAVVLVRGVPDSFPRALQHLPVQLQASAARAGHEAYVAALLDAGFAVHTVEADERCADCCFIEDTAVITGRHALLTRPGAPSRRPEVGPVGEALDPLVALHEMDPPATLDGGDVMRAGDVLFVGLSSRTNVAGAARLAEVAALDGLHVVPIHLDAGLHLKSAVTMASPSLVLLNQAMLGPEPFVAAGLEVVTVPEAVGANVLALGDRVLVSADAPHTAAILTERGFAVVQVSVTELHKADGALTCLSLRVPAPGTWCA